MATRKVSNAPGTWLVGEEKMPNMTLTSGIVLP